MTQVPPWQDNELDQYGRRQMNRRRFPGGINHLRNHLAHKGLKLGLYYLPGIDSAAVDDRVRCPESEPIRFSVEFKRNANPLRVFATEA